MKHLFPKLIFILILVLGISSFVVLRNADTQQDKDEIGNVRFNAEMDNGFQDREIPR